MYQKFHRFLGIPGTSTSLAEKFIAALGGGLSIALISVISSAFTGAQGAVLMVPSMGASAVLLFAVPHGLLSQPWALLVGNLISAAIGVACAQWIEQPVLAAALAVGLAIAAMYVFSCIHPPGGATALAAVIGGPAIHDLGYGYIVAPVLLNVLVILCVALLFNALLPWRRYPAAVMRFSDTPPPTGPHGRYIIDTRHIEQAIQDLDLLVDVSGEELQRLFALSLQHAEQSHLSPQQILLGHYYTNAKLGPAWAVRRIIDESRSPETHKDMVIYRVVEGDGLRRADSCTREEFARWAVREVFPQGSKTS